MLSQLPAPVSPVQTLTQLVLKVIDNEKIIEQSLASTVPRESPTRPQGEAVPGMQEDVEPGTSGEIQDQDALGGGRVVDVWIQQAREHLDLAQNPTGVASQGQEVTAAAQDACEMDEKTLQFIKEAEGLLKLLE